MWAAILPVVFSLLTSYSMFVFFCSALPSTERPHGVKPLALDHTASSL